MLEIKSLVKRFGPVEAVSQVNIAVPDGAFLVLLGPSGCGKTTLLRMLAGLELPTSGQIAFDGTVVSDGDRQWAVEPAKRNSAEPCGRMSTKLPPKILSNTLGPT